MRKPDLATNFELKLRRRRFEILRELLSTLSSPVRILDVGGAHGFWANLDHSTLVLDVTMVNVFPQENLPDGFNSVVGDARDLSAFRSQDFDVIFSNSVIGHVGSWRDQVRMAEEIKRFGKPYFVQTPNHYFILDWRTLVPFFHFFSTRQQAWLLHRLPIANFGRFCNYMDALGWASQVRNLSRAEFQYLFPKAVILRERVFGLTKSFMAHAGFSQL